MLCTMLEISDNPLGKTCLDLVTETVAEGRRYKVLKVPR